VLHDSQPSDRGVLIKASNKTNLIVAVCDLIGAVFCCPDISCKYNYLFTFSQGTVVSLSNV